jgi:glutathione S-transferase
MKLVYFNLRGLAETSRLILAINHEEYDDFRYNFSVLDMSKYQFDKPEFDKDKENGLLLKSMNKLPYLEVDGNIICQSKAIERYLAQRFNMMGSSLLEFAKIDSICEAVRDIKELYQSIKKKPEEEREKAMETWFKETLVERLNLLSNLCDLNGVYCVGSALSLADVVIYSLITHFFDNIQASMNAASQNKIIYNVIKNVDSIESLQNWFKNRPNTLF